MKDKPQCTGVCTHQRIIWLKKARLLRVGNCIWRIEWWVANWLHTCIQLIFNCIWEKALYRSNYFKNFELVSSWNIYVCSKYNSNILIRREKHGRHENKMTEKVMWGKWQRLRMKWPWATESSPPATIRSKTKQELQSHCLGRKWWVPLLRVSAFQNFERRNNLLF